MFAKVLFWSKIWLAHKFNVISLRFVFQNLKRSAGPGAMCPQSWFLSRCVLTVYAVRLIFYNFLWNFGPVVEKIFCLKPASFLCTRLFWWLSLLFVLSHTQGVTQYCQFWKFICLQYQASCRYRILTCITCFLVPFRTVSYIFSGILFYFCSFLPFSGFRINLKKTDIISNLNICAVKWFQIYQGILFKIWYKIYGPSISLIAYAYPD